MTGFNLPMGCTMADISSEQTPEQYLEDLPTWELVLIASDNDLVLEPESIETGDTDWIRDQILDAVNSGKIDLGL